MATASVGLLPPRIAACLSSRTRDKTVERSTALGSVLRVVRRDGEFVRERLRLAAEPFRPIHEHVSGIISDFFWFRFLEDPRTHRTHQQLSSCPRVSYPTELSGLDIFSADLETLKTYADFIQHSFQVWTMPLPDFYDHDRVKGYFSCRPHILLFRLLEVLSSFLYAAIRLQVTSIFKLSRKDENGNINSVDAAYFVGHLLKETMLSLGPTFIKVGQSLSTRPDITGSEISKALSELHDKVPPFPRATAMKILEEELGGPVENFFSYISEEPVAAASFGQVYKGCTFDGCIVAIKVQRPNLLHLVVRDIYILRLGLGILRKAAKRKSDLCLYADELGKGFVGELDYRIESANASEFLVAHSHYSFMSVPKVLGHLTGKRVLTMEYLLGENPNSLLLYSAASGKEVDEITKIHQQEAKRRLLDLVSKGVEATLVQLLETGLLHADPHPGNLCYTTEGGIGFFDFGLLCRLKKEHQFAMFASIVHIINGDWRALVYDLVSMDVIWPGTNLHHVTLDLVESLGEVQYKDGIPDFKFSLVLGKIWSIALKYHFRMPPYFTLLLRSLASFEGLALAADMNFKTFQAAYPYVVNKLLYDNSASTRRVLYSVIFNKTREIQWQKIFLFMKIGIARIKSVQINSRACYIPERPDGKHDAYRLANLLLRLLLSTDGAVLRRLMMTADPLSLARAFVSKDAILVRKHASIILANAMHRWMRKATIGSKTSGRYWELVVDAEEDYSLIYSLMRDRRLKLIFFRIVSRVRRHPVLTIRSCWSCFTIVWTALMLSLHQFMFECSESLFSLLTFRGPKIAVGL